LRVEEKEERVTERVSVQGLEFEIGSEARGPHWVAWLQPVGQPKPPSAVVFVGRTREEAEGNARQSVNSPYVAAAINR
jgi:hypothetical protein